MKAISSKFLPLAGTLALSLVGAPPILEASDNIEVVTAAGTVISHKLWSAGAFPLSWRLHEDGVINNNSVGAGTGAVTNAAAQAELTAGFQAWANVATSNITVAFGGTTTEAEAGCDLTNIVSWSDTTQGFPTTTIARGITTSYVGPDLVLNAVNRTVTCQDGGTVTLPVATYPNGTTLVAGTILDMDMVWNSTNFDYVTAANATSSVLDIRAIATHEFGHMFGFSHTSLAFAANNPATMFPIVSSSNIALQNNVRTLELDDSASSGGYPDTSHWPGGTPAFTTGAISGRVTQPAGAGAAGVRVWAFDSSATAQPVYETHTATSFDWDPSLQPGDYVLGGLAPGAYFVCIVPWSNGVPTAQAANPARYNLTTGNGVGNTAFPTECYDDAQPGSAAPSFGSSDLIRKVTVTAGTTIPNIDFVTGAQTSDFMLIMDRSGSMGWASGTPGTTRLQALQDAANAFIDYLDLSGGHRLGLVQFEENLVPLTPVFDLQALTGGAGGSVTIAHNAINGMTDGGWTNIIAGVNEGINQLTTIGTANPRQNMLVFSDGAHNRPLGSNLADIQNPVVNNDITFYSIGFGTSVDDAVLTQVAAASGGLHVNEQALSPLALGKHFLSIAASAADNTTLIDPLYELSAGETASLNVDVTPDERSLTFAVQWTTRDAKLLAVTISQGRCRISTAKPGPGFDVRRGETYQLVRVPLPYECRTGAVSAGTWTISATLVGDAPNETEDVQIIVFGNSRISMSAEVFNSRRGPLVQAKLLRSGRTLRGGSIYGEVLLPLPATKDGEKQDSGEVRPYPPKGQRSREERTVRFKLYDDGSHGDTKAGDAIYAGLVPVKMPGPYHVHLFANFKGEQTISRETNTSFYFDGRWIIGAGKRAKSTLRDRY